MNSGQTGALDPAEKIISCAMISSSSELQLVPLGNCLFCCSLLLTAPAYMTHLQSYRFRLEDLS